MGRYICRYPHAAEIFAEYTEAADLCRYPHAAEIFAEYTEAADPVGMVRRTFIAAFLAPVITQFPGNPLFRKLMLAEKPIDPAECGSLCFIFESKGLF